MKLMTKSRSQDIRFQLYHQLEETYHQLLDELAQAELTDGEIGKIAQTLMRSRLEALKPLVSDQEMDAYYEIYPEER